jgi:hypothetical protein
MYPTLSEILNRQQDVYLQDLHAQEERLRALGIAVKDPQE